MRLLRLLPAEIFYCLPYLSRAASPAAFGEDLTVHYKATELSLGGSNYTGTTVVLAEVELHTTVVLDRGEAVLTERAFPQYH